MLAYTKMPRTFEGSVANGRIEIRLNISPGIELFPMRPYMNENILDQILGGRRIVYIMAGKGDQRIKQPPKQLLKSLHIAAADLFYLNRRDISDRGDDNVLGHIVPKTDPIQPCTPADDRTCLRRPAGQPDILINCRSRWNITCKKIEIKSFVVRSCRTRKIEKSRKIEVQWMALSAPALLEPALRISADIIVEDVFQHLEAAALHRRHALLEDIFFQLDKSHLAGHDFGADP